VRSEAAVPAAAHPPLVTGHGSRFDLIVIGAGINGAGIARDATLRELRVLLLDKGDIASGTTSWSTRLIHGGLRYLEHRELGLVRESLRERERLLAIAPHLVRPLPLLIPLYHDAQRGPLLIRAGMLAYDALSFDKSLPCHRMLDRAAALRRAPGLDADGLLGAALYHDAQAEFPERLALENALDARERGADVRTYHRVERILIAEGRVTGVEGRDVLTGMQFTATAPVVFNVTGPWVDELLGETRGAGTVRLIGGTKGSHIVVAPFPGAPRSALYSEAGGDHRPFFIIPWNGLYLIGTTDTRYDGDLDRVIAEDWEIALLLEETNRVIPGARLAPDAVLYSYAGVRPLPFAPGRDIGEVTRRHRVVDHGQLGGPSGLLSTVGGKLTTYRELAEQAVDRALALLGKPLLKSRTVRFALPGGRANGSWDAFHEAFSRESGLSVRSAEHMLRIYGAHAPEVLAMAGGSEMRSVFDPWSGAIAAEIRWAFEKEDARTLTDIIARRTMIGLGPDAGLKAAAAAAAIGRSVLGWDAARAQTELEGYRDWISRYRPRNLETAVEARSATER
jgi:glycerol-3-phosphate dehydrogenase